MTVLQAFKPAGSGADNAHGTANGRDRLAERFAALKAEGRGGLVTYVMAGDPDRETALQTLRGLPAAGADVIELGMPFSDPMADGPAIQEAALRALKGGMTLSGTLDTLSAFRAEDQDTPVVLMGYYNPIYIYGPEAFARDAAAAGADGVIVVDMPPEECVELVPHLSALGLHFVFLATPTTDAARLPVVLEQAGGFVYYVSITGITGTASAAEDQVQTAVDRLKAHTDLPIAVGFGISTPEQAATMAAIGDAAVVGSAIVKKVGTGEDVLGFVKELADAVRASSKHTE